MPRQYHYEPQLAAHAGGGPAMPQITAPEVDSAGAQVARHLDSFMRVAGPLLGRAQMARETARVDEAVLEADRRMSEWQAQYQQANQGRLAADAGADYAAAWEKIAGETIRDYGGGDHTVWPDMLRGRLAERGAYAMKEGLRWQARQTELWQASQWESQLDQFQRFAASNPFSPDVGHEAQALKDSWALKHPGMDPGRVSRQIDETRIRASLDALLDQGNAAGARLLMAQAAQAAGRRADIRGMAPEIERMIREAGARHGFDESGCEMLLAQAMQESGGSQAAVSPAGALGVMQLMPGTARELGVNPRDAGQNIEGGVRYMKRLLAKYNGSWEDALRAYNMGPGGYDRVKAGRGALPQETAGYAGAVMGRLRQQVPAGLSPAALAHYQSRIDALDRQRQAAARAKMQAGIASFTAASADGHILDQPYSDEMIRAAFGEDAEAVIARVHGAKALAVDMDQASRMSLAEQDRLLQARAPDPASPYYAQEARAHELLARRVGLMQKQLLDDPVGFAAARDQTVAAARKALLEDMSRENAQAYAAAVAGACQSRGVAPRLFSKGDAAGLAEMLTRAQDPAAAVRNFAQAFGPSFPQAARELWRELSPTMRLVASGLESGAARLVLQAERDRDFDRKVEKHLGIMGTDRTAFEEKVHNSLADFHRSFLAGGDTEMPGAVEKAVTSLALQYMGRLGIKQADAVEKARQAVIGGRYEIVEQGKRPPMRIPKRLADVESVRDGLEDWLRNPALEEIDCEASPLLAPDMTAGMFRSMLAREGYWLTDGDEGGAVIFLAGRPVFGRDGKPLRKTWEQLASRGAAARAEARRIEDLAAGDEQPQQLRVD